jgi:membrane-bound lytic murein transglycosylase B
MDVAEVKALLDGVEKDQSILDRMSRPWEAMPWHEYAKIFDDQKRLDAGLAFWAAHEGRLVQAEKETGVPPQIVVAILGVETRYGTVMGKDPVVRSLYTLGFFHPRRGAFFRKELGHFLRLSADEGWKLGQVKGSYAGAMGMGQFIPSSYRNYAVDGDEDGTRDLFANPDDAVASVANYFAVHGWKAGEPVLTLATGDAKALGGLVRKGLELDRSWSVLEAAGVSTAEEVADDAKVRLFAFELASGPEHRVGHHNFYVITRYNHSQLYARAVYDLSERLRAARVRSTSGSSDSSN